MTKQGALYFDPIYDRFNIRFDLDEYYSGLHCGDCFDVLVHGKWKATRIEMYEDWYLVNAEAAGSNPVAPMITGRPKPLNSQRFWPFSMRKKLSATVGLGPEPPLNKFVGYPETPKVY